ncbi:MAG: hypothetical protein WAW90_01175 [Minisyncoccia bacterium]
MKKRVTKKETDTEMLARLMADGFGQVHVRLDGIDDRLDGMDGRFDGVENRLVHLEKGQAETNRRLDSIEKKQDGMLMSIDDTVHRGEFTKLTRRVELLEK